MTAPKPLPRLMAETGACVECSGYRNKSGYGRSRFQGKKRLAHRAAWESAFGPVPPGMCVLHKCDNPPCINPAHLFLGTIADNNADCVAKGRNRGAIGERHAGTVLTESDIPIIRALARRLEQKEIARAMGVGTSTIGRVVRRQSWQHVHGVAIEAEADARWRRLAGGRK